MKSQLRVDRDSLPNGWVWTTLSAIQRDDSVTVDPSRSPGKSYELYSVTHFDAGNPELIIGEKIGSNKKSVEEGTVLLCGINPRINRVWVVGNHSDFPKIASTEWRAFFKVEGIVPYYLAYFLRQDSFRDFLAANASGVGGSLMRVRSATFADYPFPLPPLPEQHRIVAKIEELFSDLDAGVEALKKVKAELKRYRQAVLKAAVEGKLTEEWRRGRGDSETGGRGDSETGGRGDAGTGRQGEGSVADLLERIRAERAKNGKEKKLSPIDTSELPKLPEGWEWTSMESACEKVQDGTHFSPKVQYPESGPGRFLYITAKNIRQSGLDLSDIAYIDEAFHRNIFKRCNPEKGDVLLTKDGVNTGDTAVNTLDEEFSVLSSIALLKPRKDFVIGKYIKVFIDSPLGQKMIAGQMTGTAIKRIVLERVRTSPFALCGIAEQQQIVFEVEHRLSAADEVERNVEASLKQAERLRQSILKMAFEGKLVPQDPSDEPASVLLERIRSSREEDKKSGSSEGAKNRGRTSEARIKKEKRR
ncbi:MAG: restriction endonuclease subunit S [Thaumarchaeota archaeon]|nr:restriction endonuclease subunit S [Nitrososphaerota archaeon]